MRVATGAPFYQGRTGIEASRATVVSISRRAIETLGGSFGTASGANHCASAISMPSGLRSPPAYSAVNAIISECGNDHDWLPKYVEPVDCDADFLADFAVDAVLDRLARLDEPGERAVHRDGKTIARARATRRGRG